MDCIELTTGLNDMNSVEIALSKKMQEAEPALDIFGADRKVLQVAFQDFSNYFKFDWKVEEGTIDCDVAEKMAQVYEKDPAEFESFLTVWTGLWLKKSVSYTHLRAHETDSYLVCRL